MAAPGTPKISQAGNCSTVTSRGSQKMGWRFRSMVILAITKLFGEMVYQRS